MLQDERLSVLTTVADGARYNLLAWPLLGEEMPIIPAAQMLLAVGILLGRDELSVEEDEKEALWVRITDRGCETLRQNGLIS